MRCYKCHNIIENDAKFCEYCGSEQGFSLDLIQKAMDGDDFSQQELYKRTYNNVYMVVSSLVKDEDVSHDLVQDTYIKAYSKLDQLQDPNKFRPWIKRISHNMAIDYLRKNRDIVFSDLEKDDDIVYDIEDESTSNIPDVSLSKDETRRILNRVLDDLPASQRAVITLFYYEDYAIKDIASELGISENTVKSRLKYGRDNLEKTIVALEKEHDFKLRGIAPIPLLYLLFRNVDALEVYEPKTCLVLTKENKAEVKVEENKEVVEQTKPKTEVKEVLKKTKAPMSSMMKNVIGGVVCVGLVGGAAGVYFSSQKGPKPPKPEEKPIVQKEELLSTEDVYAPVIDEYQKALGASELKDDYVYTNAGLICELKGIKDSEDGQNVYYAYYDIDHNGHEELLIGSGYKHPKIDSVYGRDKNSVKKLLQDGLNDKEKVYIYPDGTIIEILRHHQGTQYGVVYKLDEDGYTLVEEYREDLTNGKEDHEFLEEHDNGQLQVGLHDKMREEDETPINWKIMESFVEAESVDAFIGQYGNGNSEMAGRLVISREGKDAAYVRLFNSDYKEILGGKATLSKKGTLVLDGAEIIKKNDYELEIKTPKKLGISDEDMIGGKNEAEVDYETYNNFQGNNGEVLTIKDNEYVLTMNGKEYKFDYETGDAYTPDIILFYTVFVDGKRNNDYPYVQFIFDEGSVTIQMGNEEIVLRG